MKCPYSNRSNAIFGRVVGYFFGDGDGCNTRVVVARVIILIRYLGGLVGVVEVVVDAVDFGLSICDCCGDEGNEEE